MNIMKGIMNWKLRSVVQWTFLLLLLWIAVIFFYPSWNELESFERLKSKQEKHEALLNKVHLAQYENSDALKAKLKASPVTRSPVIDPEDGSVLWKDDLGAALTKKDAELREEGYRKFAFNSLVSFRLGFHRAELPDTRHEECENNEYRPAASLPTASVIVCFYREELWTLLRTIHSIIERSPEPLLKEVILVDDKSDIEIVPKVEEHLAERGLTSKVKLKRAPERLGLIRARMFGAKSATGDVLVFLDSHVEVNRDWLRPLLDRIADNETNVVTPIIDIINADTFRYEASPLVRGGFNWGLNFKWDSIKPEELKTAADFARPKKSPTMAGGLFAMNREYFFRLGAYDPGLNVWGGENLELSFKVWMCGGRLEIVPCSRVGHVFRKRRPYGADAAGSDSMIRNSLRVAKVWMDDYVRHFYSVYPEAESMPVGDIEERKALRKRLKCRDFRWYLDYVYPEYPNPPDGGVKENGVAAEKVKFQPWDKRSRTYVKAFTLRLANTRLCVRSAGKAAVKKSELTLAPCSKSQEFIWRETDKGEFVLAKILCLDAWSKSGTPRLMKCHEMGGEQEWKVKLERGLTRTAVYNMAAGTCLDVTGRRTGSKLKMDLCDPERSMMWEIRPIDGEQPDNNDLISSNEL